MMALIGVPLARLRPRQGRYARVAFAVLIFFVYIELAIAGRMWLVRGVTPGWLGLWWVHAGVALFGAVLLLCAALAGARLRYRRNMRGSRAGSGARMNMLDRYVIRAVLGGVFVVLAVLLALGALFLFAGQQDDIGVGTYTALDALWFVLLNMPQQMYETMPIARA